MKCGKPRFINPRFLLCDGNIKNVVIDEKYKIVIYEICEKCGGNNSLDPLIINKPVQMVFSGFVASSAQLSLF